MARMTWDASAEPEVQAEPEETAIPSRSMFNRRDSPSTYRKLTFSVLGSRWVWMAVQFHMGDLPEDPLLETVSQALKIFMPFGKIPPGDFTGLSQADDVGNVFRPRPAVALLGSPVNKGRKLRPFADELGPDSFGGVQLVAGEGEDVHGQFLQVDGDLSHGLHGVGMT